MINELECNLENCMGNAQSKRLTINRRFKEVLISVKIEGAEGMSKTK